jgi:hypothetical protein
MLQQHHDTCEYTYYAVRVYMMILVNKYVSFMCYSNLDGSTETGAGCTCGLVSFVNDKLQLSKSLANVLLVTSGCDVFSASLLNNLHG